MALMALMALMAFYRMPLFNALINGINDIIPMYVNIFGGYLFLSEISKTKTAPPTISLVRGAAK